MNTVELAARSSSAAPGQYLGYSLQQVRLCYHLLREPDGTSVSLEYLDDVAVHKLDGTVLLEQSKSALTGNPVSDHSVELWKTFANWAELCTDGRVNPRTSNFRLYVTPSKSADLAISLDQAVSEATATLVLASVKGLVNTKKPESGCSPYVSKFLAAGDAVCLTIIRRFSLVTTNDPIDGIRACLRATLPEDVLDDFCAAAIGMARDHVDKLIREKHTPVIAVSEFRRRFVAFVRKHNLSDFLLSEAAVPSGEEVATIVDTAPLPGVLRLYDKKLRYLSRGRNK